MARHPDVQYIRFRTDGSAARKVEVAEPIKTMRLPRVKQNKRLVLRIDPLALVAILMTVVMATLLLVGTARLNAAEQETAAMQAHVEQLQNENERLHAEFRDKCNLDQIERIAMARGMVPQDQVTHVTIHVPQETVEEENGIWERFTMFLTGLFA